MSSIYVLARGASNLARWTPRGVRHALGATVGAGSYITWRSKRLVTQQNMAQVTGRPVYNSYVRHLAFASWCNYGRYAADFMNFPYLDLGSIEQNLHDLSYGANCWQDHLEYALQQGRGAILSTAHFGNWDVAGAIVGHHVPLSAVAETFSDVRLNSLLQSQRKMQGIDIIPMEKFPRRILRVLQQNQLVAIVFDRAVAPDQGVPVSFFGRTTYLPGGPAMLAFKSGAPIIPGYVWYGRDHHFCLRAFPPIFPRKCRSEEQANEIMRLTQAMCDALEEMVCEYPTQWYMFRPFWPSIP